MSDSPYTSILKNIDSLTPIYEGYGQTITGNVPFYLGAAGITFGYGIVVSGNEDEVETLLEQETNKSGPITNDLNIVEDLYDADVSAGGKVSNDQTLNYWDTILNYYEVLPRRFLHFKFDSPFHLEPVDPRRSNCYH